MRTTPTDPAAPKGNPRRPTRRVTRNHTGQAGQRPEGTRSGSERSGADRRGSAPEQSAVTNGCRMADERTALWPMVSHAAKVSHTAWYPTRQRYPTRHGIPRGMVSHAAWSSWYSTRTWAWSKPSLGAASRTGYRAVRDTVLCGIQCRAGYLNKEWLDYEVDAFGAQQVARDRHGLHALQ